MEFPEYVRHMNIDLMGTVTAVDPADGTFTVKWQGDETEVLSLSDEGDEWYRMPDRETALKCLDIVRAYVKDDTAMLRDPGHEGPYWSIGVELGWNWAYTISTDGTVAWPDGVGVEAVNVYAIGLHTDRP